MQGQGDVERISLRLARFLRLPYSESPPEPRLWGPQYTIHCIGHIVVMQTKTSIYFNKCLQKAFSTASTQRIKQTDFSICCVSSKENDFFEVFKNANISVNSVTSTVLAVSLSTDIIAARCVSLSSVIVDL